MSSDNSSSDSKSYLFSDVKFNSPLEELRLVSMKKIKTHEELGETERVEELRLAYEIARQRLALHLGEQE